MGEGVRVSDEMHRRVTPAPLGEVTLTQADLEKIVDTLDALKVSRLRIRGELEVAGHLLTVRWESDQREGDWPVVVGIRRA